MSDAIFYHVRRSSSQCQQDKRTLPNRTKVNLRANVIIFTKAYGYLLVDFRYIFKLKAVSKVVKSSFCRVDACCELTEKRPPVSHQYLLVALKLAKYIGHHGESETPRCLTPYSCVS